MSDIEEVKAVAKRTDFDADMVQRGPDAYRLTRKRALDRLEQYTENIGQATELLEIIERIMRDGALFAAPDAKAGNEAFSLMMGALAGGD